MNIRWLRSNGTLLALLAVIMVTVGLLATLVVRQQHDQATETGQVYLDKSDGGTNTAVPLIPANPPQPATGDRGVDSAPAPQPVGTDSSDCRDGRYGDGRPCDSTKPAPADELTAPITAPSSNVTRSNGSAHSEAVIPSGSSGHSDPPARGADESAIARPPRDAGEPDQVDQSIPPRRPSQPHQPAQPAKPTEPVKPAQPRRPAESDNSTEQSKPGKPADGKPGKPADGKPGKPADQGKPGKPADGKPGKPAGEGKPGQNGKPGKPVDANESDGSGARTQQTLKPGAPDSAETRETTSDPDALTQSEPVVEEGAEGAGSDEQRGVEQADGHHAHS